MRPIQIGDWVEPTAGEFDEVARQVKRHSEVDIPPGWSAQVVDVSENFTQLQIGKKVQWIYTYRMQISDSFVKRINEIYAADNERKRRGS